MKSLFLLLPLLAATTSWAYVIPKVGALCPPSFNWDGANCFRAKPTQGKSFIYNNNFYHTGKNCEFGSTFDGANCYLGPVPWNYSGFIYDNAWYVSPLPHFQGKTSKCPSGFNFDGANCWYGKAPSGHNAKIILNHFAFSRSFYANCSKIMPGAYGLVDPFSCGVKALSIELTKNAFIYDNSWYVKPVAGVPDTWLSKSERNDSDSTLFPICQNNQQHSWSLVWSDEFNDVPDNQKCYTSVAEEPRCVYKAFWGSEPCRDRPKSWNQKALATWTSIQTQKYKDLRNLNKCRWQIFDSFNNWDASEKDRTNSFLPSNISIQGGILKMKTLSHSGTSYDCGRGTVSDPSKNGQEFTKICPYSGASLQSSTDLPWTASNSPDKNDPSQRYVGFASGYGRYEFKAKINKLGHGGWPALWMFGDNGTEKGQGTLELDALEFLADLRGAQGFNDNVTYGMAIQTAHNWGGNGSGLPHIGSGNSLPISLGEWHIYAVEWEPNEIRFYIDDCLRRRIKDGDTITQSDGSKAVFHVPKNQNISIIIGNPASGAGWLPAWYRTTLTSQGPRSDFKSTEMEVDYVRVYGVKNTSSRND